MGAAHAAGGPLGSRRRRADTRGIQPEAQHDEGHQQRHRRPAQRAKVDPVQAGGHIAEECEIERPGIV